MKIKLIQPVYYVYSLYSKSSPEALKSASPAFAPLGLLILAALTDPDIEVQIEDEYVKRIDFDEKVDLVGITAVTHTAARAYEIAGEYKKRGVKVVMGGIHVSNCPHEALEYADAIVIGEGEYVWKKLLKDFKEKRLQKVYRSESLVDPKDIPIPRYELLDSKNYSIWPSQTTRGCPFDCSFCSATNFFGRTFRCRNAEDVIKEIRVLKNYAPSLGMGRPFIFFAEDNITGNPNHARKLFNALIPLEINWASQCSINIADDPELLNLARRSGCKLLCIGFESLSEKVLKEMNKTINHPAKYREVISKVRKEGIIAAGSFIFGFDSDDDESILKTTEFSLHSNLDFSTYYVLTPFPGTRLYEKLKNENRLIAEDWWKKENQKVLVENVFYIIKHPFAREIRKEAIDAERRFYSFARIFGRLFKLSFNVWKFFLAVSLTYHFANRKFRKFTDQFLK